MNKIIKAVREKTDAVLVGFSCGKDSAVTLDICRQVFPRVECFFMYLVPDLSFQQRYISYISARFAAKIHQLPHWQLGAMLRNNSYRNDAGGKLRPPLLKLADIEAYAREQTGIHYIAYGHKNHDSFERRAMLKHCVGFDEKAGRFYPIMDFSKEMVMRHMMARNIAFAPDYRYWGRSFGRLWPAELAGIKAHFPEDYQKILEVFPYAEAVLKKREFAAPAGADKVPEIREDHDQPAGNKKRAVQSKAH